MEILFDQVNSEINNWKEKCNQKQFWTIDFFDKKGRILLLGELFITNVSTKLINFVKVI